MHKHAPGFFPGTGASGAAGAGSGCGFALNLSLGDGLREELFLAAFAELAGGAVAAFKPDCIVLQWCALVGWRFVLLLPALGKAAACCVVACGQAPSHPVPQPCTSRLLTHLCLPQRRGRSRTRPNRPSLGAVPRSLCRCSCPGGLLGSPAAAAGGRRVQQPSSGVCMGWGAGSTARAAAAG